MNSLPNGFYKGSVGFKTSWEGKKFNAENSSGINLFDGQEKYPFKTYEEKDVLKIDYNLPENPFWVRLILDEIVEISKDKYLGTIKLRLIPGFPVTIGHFRLEK